MSLRFGLPAPSSRRYAQESTAGIADDGSIEWCSNETDSKGSLLWHEEGSHSGECIGIDFAKASSLLQEQGKCNVRTNAVCEWAEPSDYIPYAYDAAIAMASALHQLVEVDAIDMMKVSGRHVVKVLSENVSFSGATGNMRFKQDKDMGDREARDVTVIILNHQGTSTGFDQAVGVVQGGSYKSCDKLLQPLLTACKGYIFPDGSGNIPLDKEPAKTTPAPVDPCKSNPCKNEGNCTANFGNLENPFNCTCAMDWLGDTCTETRKCSLDAQNNMFKPRGLRVHNFPQQKDSEPIKFKRLRKVASESECLPNFKFQGTTEFHLACCPLPSDNGTRSAALVQFGGKVMDCQTYERLHKSGGLIGYNDTFYRCSERQQRYLKYILIAVVSVLHLCAAIVLVVYIQCTRVSKESKKEPGDDDSHSTSQQLIDSINRADLVMRLQSLRGTVDFSYVRSTDDCIYPPPQPDLVLGMSA